MSVINYSGDLFHSYAPCIFLMIFSADSVFGLLQIVKVFIDLFEFFFPIRWFFTCSCLDQGDDDNDVGVNLYFTMVDYG